MVPVLVLTEGRRPDLGTLTAASPVRQRLPPSLELSSHKAGSHNENFIPQSGLREVSVFVHLICLWTSFKVSLYWRITM